MCSSASLIFCAAISPARRGLPLRSRYGTLRGSRGLEEKSSALRRLTAPARRRRRGGARRGRGAAAVRAGAAAERVAAAGCEAALGGGVGCPAPSPAALCAVSLYAPGRGCAGEWLPTALGCGLAPGSRTAPPWREPPAPPTPVQGQEKLFRTRE